MTLPAAFVDQLRENFPPDALALDEHTRVAHGYDNSRCESLRLEQPDAKARAPESRPQGPGTVVRGSSSA